MQQGDIESAEVHLQKALEGFLGMGVQRRATGYVLVNLAEVALRKGQIESARALVHEAAQQADQLGETIVKANSELLLARIDTAQNEIPAAYSHFTKAIQLLREQKMPQRLREAHLAFGRLLRQNGEITLAADQFEQAAVAGEEANQPGLDWMTSTLVS